MSLPAQTIVQLARPSYVNGKFVETFVNYFCVLDFRYFCLESIEKS